MLFSNYYNVCFCYCRFPQAEYLHSHLKLWRPIKGAPVIISYENSVVFFKSKTIFFLYLEYLLGSHAV